MSYNLTQAESSRVRKALESESIANFLEARCLWVNINREFKGYDADIERIESLCNKHCKGWRL